MTKIEVPFFEPDIGPEEIKEVVNCLENGWLTTGKKAEQFERDFADYIGKEDPDVGELHAITVNSATAGLHLALEAVGIEADDEVIVPDYTFTATAEVIRYFGAHPVFVDVQHDTLNTIQEAITSKTKAVMPVHFAGLTCEMQEITEIADAHDIRIIEDAAHAIPTSNAGRRIGSFAESAAVFSFYATKTITTGEGGMVVTKNAEIADRIQKMRLHGIDRNAFDRFNTGNWQYDVVAPGYKYNLTDIAAAMGIHQLRRADEFHEKRSSIAMRYLEGLKGLPLELPAMAKSGDVHSWHLFIPRVTSESRLTRDQLFEALREKGIMCSVHYTPLHRLNYWREKYDLKGQDFPNAERAGQTAISLPIYTKMTDDKVEYVIDTIRDLIG